MTQSQLDDLRRQLDAEVRSRVLVAPARKTTCTVIIPSGATLRGEVWGKITPLWVEAGSVYSLAGPVSLQAPVWVSGDAASVETAVQALRSLGYERVYGEFQP